MKIEPWLSWLRSSRYSSWESSIEPYDGQGKILRTPQPVAKTSLLSMDWNWETKARAMTVTPYLASASDSPRPDRLYRDSRGQWRVSNRLDTGDVGNRLVFGIIGAYHVEERPDLTRFIKLCGPNKRDIPLSAPHYDLPGGHAFKKIDASRLILHGCTYEAGGEKRATLFRDLPRQRLRRVEGTAILVSVVENDEIRISLVDFAPQAPELSLLCRVFVVENLGGGKITDLSIHHLAINSHSTWDNTADGPSHQARDREDGLGFALYGKDFAAPDAGTLLRGTPEESWQTLDLPLRLPRIGAGESAVSSSILIPLIKGGDPEETRALAAAKRFDPWKKLAKAQKFWQSWSEDVRLESDNTWIAGLADSLQVLLKTHEGTNGFHLGAAFQRHTHCWIRDNYLMQRGLLAAGRFEETAVNLRGFLRCWKTSGIACGYNVQTAASWVPGATEERCAYLILMVRDLHLWTGAAPELPGVWEMVKECADTIRVNSRGLVGFDGDEIWIWELDPRLFSGDETAGGREPEKLFQYSVLDNCWLTIAALTYAERLARARGELAQAAQWADKKNAIAAAVEEHLWDPSRGHYSSFLYPDGRRYAGLLVNGLCTPYFFGLEETRPGSFAAGIAACGRELMTAEGLVKGNSDTETYAGLSPAFYLHALGRLGCYEDGDEYLEALVRQLPASGGTWEYSAVDCPVTGTDKRRGGDSGILLATLAEYATGFRPTWDGFVLRPHLPRQCRTMSFSGLRFHGSRLDVVLDEKGTSVKLGRRKLFIPRGSGLEWNAEAATAKLFSL